MAETYGVSAVFEANMSSFMAGIATAMSGMSQFETKANQSSSNASNSMKSVGRAMTVTGAATTALGVSALKSYGTFSQTMNQAAVVAGGTSKDIGGLTKVAEEMGNKLPVSSQEAANAMLSMARDGANLSTIKKEFPAIAEAATASGADLQTTAGVVQQAMNVWGDSFESPAQAASILTQTANLSNASIDSMQQALAAIGGTAKNAGVSMQDASTAIGLLTNKGFSSAQASQDLNHALIQMQAPSKQAKKTMDQLGISFTDAQGNMKSLPSILQEISTNMDGMSSSQKAEALKKMFGTAGMGAILPLLDSIKDKSGNTTTSWQAFSDQIQKTSKDGATATKSLEDQSAEMQQNIGSKLKRLNDNWGSYQNAAASSQSGVTGSLIDSTNQIVRWGTTSNDWLAKVSRSFVGLAPVVGPGVTATGQFITNFEKISGASSSAVKGVTGFAKNIGPAISNAKKFERGSDDMAAAVKSMSKESKLATAVMQELNFAMDLNPAVKIAIAITALVAILVWFFTQTKLGKDLWKGFVDWLGQAWNGLVGVAKIVWSAISDAFTTVVDVVKAIWQPIGAFLTGIWNGFVESLKPIIEALKNAWEPLSEFFGMLFKAIVVIVGIALAPLIGTITAIVGAIKVAFAFLGPYISGIWHAIVIIITGVWNVIVAAVTMYINIVKDVIVGVFNVVKDVIQTVWNVISAIIGGVWKIIVTIISTAINVVAGVIKAIMAVIRGDWSGAWDAIKGVASAIWNGISSIIGTVIHTIASVIGSVVHGIASVMSDVWNFLTSITSSVWNGIKNIIKNAMHIDLFGAGKAIIDGFVRGLTSAWEAGKKFVGGIAKWIKDHKGPISYDARLLVPAGNAIMSGLNGGLNSGFKDVQSNVAGMASKISDSFGTANLAYEMTPITSGFDLNSDGTVSMSLDNQKQPANINIGMGQNTYSTFVDDISNEQGKAYDLQKNNAVNVF